MKLDIFSSMIGKKIQVGSRWAGGQYDFDVPVYATVLGIDHRIGIDTVVYLVQYEDGTIGKKTVKIDKKELAKSMVQPILCPGKDYK